MWLSEKVPTSPFATLDDSSLPYAGFLEEADTHGEDRALGLAAFFVAIADAELALLAHGLAQHTKSTALACGARRLT